MSRPLATEPDNRAGVTRGGWRWSVQGRRQPDRCRFNPPHHGEHAMKRLLSSFAVVGVLAALPHHSASAQAADTTKKATAVAAKKEAKEEKKEEMKEAKEAHPRLVDALPKLTESKQEMEATPPTSTTPYAHAH